MKKTITVESLKAERKALTEELQALDRLIAIRERRNKTSHKTEQEQVNNIPLPISIREQVVTTIYNLGQELGREVTSKEIFARLDKLKVLEGKKNKLAFLAATLDQLVKSKRQQVVRTKRGVYDIIRYP